MDTYVCDEFGETLEDGTRGYASVSLRLRFAPTQNHRADGF
jgi:hypothetical protein